VSTAGSVELVRQARQAGQRVSTEVCPHHLLLTDEACATYDPNYKMKPPLRSKKDVAARVAGVRDGTIECLATDHAPHSREDKQYDFQSAPYGIIGLETALGLFIKALIEPQVIAWPAFIAALSTNPARLLGVKGGTLAVGAPADVTIIDPEVEWTVDAEQMLSKSANTPFDGWKLRGRSVATLVDGVFRFRDGKLVTA
jgi:dihydroorotase